MERDVPKDPLAVGYLENFRDKLLGSVLSIEITAGHCQMKCLDGVEMRGDVALREFPPSYYVLTGRQCLELRRHVAHS